MRRKAETYFFYVASSGSIKPNSISTVYKSYTLVHWRSTVWRISPKGLFNKAFLFWWLLEQCGLFCTHDYSVCLVYLGKELIHTCVVLPKHCRTPFMSNEDLQIGPIWTKAEHRRRGIASWVLQEVFARYGQESRQFWYIARKNNRTSQRFIEDLGFIRYGKGRKQRARFFGLLNVFHIEETRT